MAPFEHASVTAATEGVVRLDAAAILLVGWALLVGLMLFLADRADIETDDDEEL